MRELTVAACNVVARPVADFGEFAAHVRSLLDRASDADLVVFPELLTLELAAGMGAVGDDDLLDLPRLAELTDDYRDLFRREAAERGKCILAGSHLVIEVRRPLNVAHLFLPGGAVHTHAKTHAVAGERAEGIEEGDSMEPVMLPFAKVGVTVCYEIEFPESAEALVGEGAEVLLCPSLTRSEHGFWRVRHCLHARCVEHQVFGVHSGFGGQPPALPGGGFARSAILAPCDSPWPTHGVLVETESNAEDVAIARLDLALLEESRRACPAPTHRDRRRRADLHSAWRAGAARRSPA